MDLRFGMDFTNGLTVRSKLLTFLEATPIVRYCFGVESNKSAVSCNSSLNC